MGLDDRLDHTILEVIDRFENGDYLGALALADRLLDDKRVPVVQMSPDDLKLQELDHREGLVVSLVDGTLSLEGVLEASGMPMIDALRVLCELVERGILTLRPR